MNFLVLAVDSLRADRLTSPRRIPPIPNLQKLTRQATVFSQAVTACVVTTPSFASLFTGRYPPAHGINSLYGCRLAPQCPSLVESFTQAGYYTFAEMTGPLLECVGLNRGFVSYRCRDQDEHLLGPWGEKVIESFRGREHPEPWFGLIHLWEMHSPYFVPPGFDDIAYGHYRYDRSLAALDQIVGQLVDALPEDTVLVIMGDHGESLSLRDDLRLRARIANQVHRRVGYLWEYALLREHTDVFHDEDLSFKARIGRTLARGLTHLWKPPSCSQFYRRWGHGHGSHLYDEVVRVPLLFLGPRFKSKVVTEQVRSVDILPTLLDLAGLPLEEELTLDGCSLLPMLRGEDQAVRMAYCMTGGDVLPDRRQMVQGMRTPQFKYFYSPFAAAADEVEELYDLLNDPGERRNIAGQRPQVASELRSQCEAITATCGASPQKVALTAEDEAILADRLRQLGYLE